MKAWSVPKLAFVLALPAVCAATGCSLLAGIQDPTLESGDGADATVPVEAGGGNEGGGGEGATTNDAGGDAQDAAQPTEDGNVGSADGNTVDAGSPLGATCTGDAGGGCASGYCVNGVCCESACNGQCEACDVPDAGGTCAAVSGAPHGSRESCVGAGTTCAGTCAPGNTAGCTYPGSATSCRAQSCAGGEVTPGAGCNGSGTCAASTAVSCSNPDACNDAGTGCANACANDGQCNSPTPYCNSGACKATKEPGLTCAANSDCTSDFCVDGYCCTSACGSDCQACDVAGSLGTCTQIPAGEQPHGTTRAKCTGADAGLCGGACQTASATACTYPTVSCGAESCSGSTLTLATSCSAGVCPTASKQSCGTCETCNAGGTQCTASSMGTACGSAGDACYSGSCVAASAPRPIAPLSTALATSQKPTFRWALASDTTGAEVQICSDRACSSVVQTFTATGASGAPKQIALAKGNYFWRLYGMIGSTVGATASPVWQLRVGARSAAVSTSWGTIVDPNGDGYADLLVAASQTGAAYVYPSTGAGGLSSTSTATLTVTGGSSLEFGASVASAGDVNGDGFADIVVGAPGNKAYVFLSGGTGGITTTSPITISAPAGSSYFGASVASAGDVNGDGYGDIVVGAEGGGTYNGGAFIYLGSASGTVTTPATSLPGYANSAFGGSVASAGDANGDGYGDVIVGASGYGATPQGVVYVYLGGASGLTTTPISWTNADGGYGGSVACAGDVNGDGYADVIIGDDSLNAYTGAAYVVVGPITAANNSTSAPIPVAGGAGAEFGIAVSGAGDVNGDGYADVVVGAIIANASAGGAYVYLGGTSATFTSSTALTNPNAPAPGNSGYFGAAVAEAGDVNGDGYADVAVGAWANGGSNGDAYVFGGTSGGTGLATSPLASFAGASGAHFGSSLE